MTLTVEQLVERQVAKLLERAAFMRQAGHNDDADLDEEVAATITRLVEERDRWEAACDSNTAIGAEIAEKLKAGLDAAEARATALQQRRDKLEVALRMARCPRPANHRPDEFDIGDCCDAGECGCFARAALQGSAKQ